MSDHYAINFDFYPHVHGRGRYVLRSPIRYWSPRYRKAITVPEGYQSDGASFIAPDIITRAWWLHDILCDVPLWDDGTSCNRWQSSMVLCDVMREEGRTIRAWLWFLPTWLGGFF